MCSIGLSIAYAVCVVLCIDRLHYYFTIILLHCCWALRLCVVVVCYAQRLCCCVRLRPMKLALALVIIHMRLLCERYLSCCAAVFY